ncbi:MAG: electron transport complex subunit E [candidate division KSB1 bacterium]|nr:electron transport complex subunit E [candidate division KSB1 bacterium]MDZ7347071.1 electron transport complex subunit E [candidate division KSB1 bacterium]
MSALKEFTKGIYKENPIFRQMLGCCPMLATSGSVESGLGMGVAATFVLICSNVIISLIRGIVPKKIRIPIYIVVIATFVTIVDLAMAGFLPALHKTLGIFVPLIVVNCIILGRAEAFAGKNSVGLAFLDGLGMGLGFMLALFILGTIREILGNGTFMGVPVMSSSFEPVLLMVLPPGAFLVIGFLLGFFNWIERRRTARS